MDQEEWEKYITEYMTNEGWTCDRNDENTLGFSFTQGKHTWIRDYDKKKRRFVQFDGNTVVNLKVKNAD